MRPEAYWSSDQAEPETTHKLPELICFDVEPPYLKQPICKCRFAMIDMSDDGEISGGRISQL